MSGPGEVPAPGGGGGGGGGAQPVSEGDHVVLKREEVFKAVQVHRGRKITFEKQWFYLDNAIGQQYGTTFEVSSGGVLQPLKVKTKEVAKEVNEAGVDNRNIIDDGKSQKLSRDDIEALKEQGLKGQDIVQHLIENSTTFRDKTGFAQEKYIKKKKKKYEAFITILKPTTRIMAMMYHSREPGKICYLRYDTLAQMLTLGNIHAGSKVIVAETCAGLVLGAVMERLGGFGSVIHMYPGSLPIRAAMENFGFPKSFYNHLYDFPINKLNSLLSGVFLAEKETLQKQTEVMVEEGNGSLLNICQGDGMPCGETVMDNNKSEETEAMDVACEEAENKEKNSDRKSNVEERKSKQEDRLKKLQAAAAVLQERNADGLIIASRLYPSPLLLCLLEFVAPSRPFVIYCQYKEPLLVCYSNLRERGGVVNLRLSETWLRGYQVLPNRTHPKLTMSGGGGYILTGITVAMDRTKSVANISEEPAAKRQKTMTTSKELG
ncbi:tRNA (adenine(58)-N(1))-methyltransferase non-catalytic subunit TRM6 isoform X2 [Chiloscyllium plagiosum]|uniref:tRNA (adenine(58)-N(1))-methyltransferase non-catalytic subunit TRM6 isoform X2 n=1 Tax=Chiloscyllium plagiosum TaxID=36176 RepID=UPI001CB84B01|nr:tRNA (adenine(58)-N(1))-methyltransferase non-catalytic subunit TRM6 isoform X2 [Chiloscyllium plagiosum]